MKKASSSIDRAKFKTETGRKLFDMLVNIWDDNDFVTGVLCDVRGDEKRQKLIDFIERENITNDEEVISEAWIIAGIAERV